MSQGYTQQNTPLWFGEALGFSHLVFMWGAGPKTPWRLVMAGFWGRLAIVIFGVVGVTFEALDSFNGLLFWAMVASWCFGGYYVYQAMRLEYTASRHFGSVRNAVKAAAIAASWHHTSSYPGGWRKLFEHVRLIDMVYKTEPQPHTQ